MARLSIKKFAREIGLSVGTVSAALNGMDSVKAETAEYVRRKAHEYGYAPNPWARKMQNRASRLFAIVLPRGPTNLTNTLTQEILDVLRQEGFASTVYYIEDADEVDIYRTPVDGFIFISASFPRLRASLKTREIPYLVIDPEYARLNTDSQSDGPAILLDRRAAAREAADILHRAGCSHFFFVGPAQGPKYDGYAERVGELTGDSSVVVIDPRSGLTSGGDHIHDLVVGANAQGSAPAGIWAAGLRDMAALMRVCDKSGIEIGRDIYTLYWGAHFRELPGFEDLSYIGEPTDDFFAALLDWAHDPKNTAREPVWVTLEAQLRSSVRLPASREIS